jgi:dimethylargininase
VSVVAPEAGPAGVQGVALVREPGPLLAGGIVTYLTRTGVDLARAREQHAGYAAALGRAGWRVVTMPAADDCPDAVFVEDTVVVVDDLAVITRPAAPQRRPEIQGTEVAVSSLGLRIARITEPGMLDGGDVLQVGPTVYVGLGTRTNGEGIRQLAALLAPIGRRVVAVRLREVLHLKSAVTALPDGSLIGLVDLLDASALPVIRVPPEPDGAHVVRLGNDQLLISAAAPRTAAWLGEQGFAVHAVDIAEFTKLEGCVTCLSVLLPGLDRGGDARGHI